MSNSTELLQGSLGVIEAWLLDDDPRRSLMGLRVAIDVGGRALLTCESADESMAERYRNALLRLREELPVVEARLNHQRRKLQQERESLDRAMQWASETRQNV